MCAVATMNPKCLKLEVLFGFATRGLDNCACFTATMTIVHFVR